MISKLRQTSSGFTLAELLISLAILVVIATFSIPKILTAQQNAQSNAKAKEVAGMISNAYQQAQLAGLVTANTKPSDLTPYINYLAWDTTSPIDAPGTFNTVNSCSAVYPCVRLHNGGLLLFNDTCYFAGTSSNNFMQFWFDPDGVVAGGGDGPSKSVYFDIYTNGLLTTRDKLKAGSICGTGTYGPAAAYDPSWFSW